MGSLKESGKLEREWEVGKRVESLKESGKFEEVHFPHFFLKKINFIPR